jgi:hypothetical protein
VISEAIAWMNSMTELAVVEEAVRLLVHDRRTLILQARKKAGEQVGFIQRQKINGKIVEQPCNGVVKELKNGYAIIEVVSPIRFATRLVQVDYPLVRDPYQIVEKTLTGLSDGQDQDPEADGGFSFPVG